MIHPVFIKKLKKQGGEKGEVSRTTAQSNTCGDDNVGLMPVSGKGKERLGRGGLKHKDVGLQ